MYEQIGLWDSQIFNITGEVTPAREKVIISTDGDVILYEDFFSKTESRMYFSELKDKTKWKDETIQIFGKETNLPRRTAWYGDEGKSYTYSGIHKCPEPWTDLLIYIKSRIEKLVDIHFNSALLNEWHLLSDH